MEASDAGPEDLGGPESETGTWRKRWSVVVSSFGQLAQTRVLAGLSVVAALLILFWALPGLSGAAGGNVVLLGFQKLRNNLPLTLPILSACLSIMLNVRDLIKPHGWVRLSLPLSLGLVSFSIWYVVAAQSTSDQFIRIGPNKLLDRDYAVLLLVMAFIWAAFVALCRGLGERPDSSGDEAVRSTRWYLWQGVLLTVAIVGIALPFFLFESKQSIEARLRRSLDEAYFSVSIPFRDVSLNQHLGRATEPITLCEVAVQVPAKTAAEAVEIARKSFLASPRSTQQYGKTRDGDPPRHVEIMDALVVAERVTSLPR